MPKKLERIAADKDWKHHPGRLPRFGSPTLFLGLEGEPTINLESAPHSLPAGSALLIEAGVPARGFAFQGKGQWLGVKLDSRPLTIYGQQKDGKVFAAAMTGVEGWPQFRELISVCELLTRPSVQMTPKANVEVVRVLIHYLLKSIETYPWRGGQLPGGDLSLSSPDVVGMSGLEFGAVFVDRMLRRGEVASGVGISESYLSTVFQTHLNTNLTDYLLTRRLTHADGLLFGGEVPVSEIAKLCGFTSANYFIRVFKRVRKTTPLQIRKLAQKQILSAADAAKMFHYDTFERLSPISEREAQAMSHSIQPNSDRALMIANSRPEPVYYDWEHAPGEYYEVAVVPPLNVELFWHPSPAVWRLRTADRVIGHFMTERDPSQILV